MQRINYLIVFALGFIYFVLYKFVFINSVLYLNIREYHSRSYLKKHKSKKLTENLFFTNYKNELSKFYYYQNIVVVIVIIICLISSIISPILSYGILKILFLIILSLFYLSLLNWEIESTFSRIKSKSLMLKVLMSAIYAVLTFFIIFEIINVFNDYLRVDLI